MIIIIIVVVVRKGGPVANDLKIEHSRTRICLRKRLARKDAINRLAGRRESIYRVVKSSLIDRSNQSLLSSSRSLSQLVQFLLPSSKVFFPAVFRWIKVEYNQVATSNIEARQVFAGILGIKDIIVY